MRFCTRILEPSQKNALAYACNIIDQNEYISKYDGFVKRYETTKIELEKFQNKKHQRLSKRDAIGAFMFELSERDEVITVFDDRLFVSVVERVWWWSLGTVRN